MQLNNEDMCKLKEATIIAFDTETYDPQLMQLGPGVYRQDGHVLGVSIATDNGFAEYFNIGHYDCTEKEREENVALVRWILALPVDKLGANVQYDVDWLMNWKGSPDFGFRGKGIQANIEGRWLDIQVAEPLIDENQGKYNLDFLAQKYLGRGKMKTEIGRFCEENGLKGDERAWLYKMPYALVHKYAVEDVVEPIEIFTLQKAKLEEDGLMPVFELETALLKATMNMRYEGVVIDSKVRDINSYEANNEREERIHRLREKYGDVNFNSTQQLASLFDKENIPYNYKLRYLDTKEKEIEKVICKENAKLVMDFIDGDKDPHTKFVVNSLTNQSAEHIITCNPTIGKEYLEGLEQQDTEDFDSNLIKDILFVRRADKMLGTFLQGSLKANIAMDGKIHPSINTVRTNDFGTRTGRFSMSNPNLQQIPSKSRDKYWGKLCREPFIPYEECWWGKLDYSQIEYRCLAHYASGPGARELVQTYNNDPHTDYHQYVVDLTGLNRSFAKNLNFGCMYGMGISHMAEFFNWELDYAKEIMSIYHDRAPYIKFTMNAVSNVARSRGYIKTLAGRRAHLVDKDKAYKMLNSLLQGSAADIMKKAMVDIYYTTDILSTLKWHITVHDELNWSIPKTAQGVRSFVQVKHAMEQAYTLKVPVKAEMEIGTNWAMLNDFGFDDLNITEKDWLDDLTDTNVEARVEQLVASLKQLKDERKAKKEQKA